MPHFINNDRYSELLADLRTAALTTEWRSALAEVLAGADILPEVCRGDFEGDAA